MDSIKKDFKQFINTEFSNNVLDKKTTRFLNKTNKYIKHLDEDSAKQIFEVLWLFYEDFMDAHEDELNSEYDNGNMNDFEDFIQYMIDSGASVYASDGTAMSEVNTGKGFTETLNKLIGGDVKRNQPQENKRLNWIKRPPFIIKFDKDSITMNESFSDFIYEVLEEEANEKNDISPYKENIPVTIDEYNLIFSEYEEDSLAIQLVRGASHLQKFSFYPDNDGTAHLDKGLVKYFHKSTNNKFVGTIYSFNSSSKAHAYIGTKIFPISVDLTGGNKDVK